MSEQQSAVSGLKLPAIFGDHMVLQQAMPIPVWGWDIPGTRITVAFDGASASTTSDSDGRWSLRLPAHAVATGLAMTITGSTTIRLTDVAVGEVWLCSGQSNMEWPVKLSANAESELAHADHPNIRLFMVPKRPAASPQDDAPGGQWRSCNSETLAPFSAVGYFFGRELHRELNVPIGLMNASWGGTAIETWTSREALLAEPRRREMMATFLKSLQDYDGALAEYHARFRQWQERHLPSDPGNTGHAKGWADPTTPTADWPAMQCPCIWQSAGLSFNGVVWFRKELNIPAEWAGRDLVLSLGVCDDYDITYFDNVQIVATGRETPRTWELKRVYTVPASMVKAGRHVLTIRVFDHLGGGGLTGPAASMFVTPAGAPDSQRISLVGAWQYQVEHNFGIVRAPGGPMPPPAPENPNAPAALYNGLIHPLVPYAMRGVIWYQGEANAPDAWDYRKLFPNMIRDWRDQWAQGDFPFLFVQLANHQARRTQASDSQWAELREAQLVSLKVPHTAMAVTIDIGEAADVHPKNKQDVGRRLAAPALAHTYGRTNVVASGPMYKSSAIEGKQIRLAFDELGGGLTCHGDELTGFAIAGEDQHFVWASARIEGDSVVVWSPEVTKPAAVRYAWGDNPECNLYNKAGFPASPFRTDNWRLTTHVVGD